MGWVVNATLRSLYPWKRDKVPVLEEAGWAPGKVWMGAEEVSLTGIRSPNREARSKLLYRLSYSWSQNIFRNRKPAEMSFGILN